MAFQTPMFYKYYSRTYRIDSTPDGGLMGTILNLHTGFFEQDQDSSHILELIWSTTESNIRGPYKEEKFIQETEFERSLYLTGDGPIFALYDTIKGIDDVVRKEGRRRTPQEVALIEALRKRTFKMWEDEAARIAAGEPPSFTVTSRLSPRQ
ncbi:hypothetical protein [Amycolatopsis tolypomycina]|uniref:Uncharacterized protein n=1 Tax=Amycolatopsis tolypomycina TaxID=208445 RepID=A0A1H4J369_9PSEU|nr:hypothetical protein [Amycolatopsis tolypomycina]SEB40416.1 hypothetical protein SAMN04489727_1440 [Amycolatopsis tolypomycina]